MRGSLNIVCHCSSLLRIKTKCLVKACVHVWSVAAMSSVWTQDQLLACNWQIPVAGLSECGAYKALPLPCRGLFVAWSLSNIGNCSAICSKHQFLILYTWFCAAHWPQRSCWNINICKIKCWTKSVCQKSRNSMQIYREYREHRLDYRIYGYTS